MNRIAVLGLAFKNETDDIHDSSAILIIRKLIEEGADIYTYDPSAMKKIKNIFFTLIIVIHIRKLLNLKNYGCILSN